MQEVVGLSLQSASTTAFPQVRSPSSLLFSEAVEQSKIYSYQEPQFIDENVCPATKGTLAWDTSPAVVLQASLSRFPLSSHADERVPCPELGDLLGDPYLCDPEDLLSDLFQVFSMEVSHGSSPSSSTIDRLLGEDLHNGCFKVYLSFNASQICDFACLVLVSTHTFVMRTA